MKRVMRVMKEQRMKILFDSCIGTWHFTSLPDPTNLHPTTYSTTDLFISTSLLRSQEVPRSDVAKIVPLLTRVDNTLIEILRGYDYETCEWFYMDRDERACHMLNLLSLTQPSVA